MMRNGTKTVRPRPTTMETTEGSKKRQRGDGGKARKQCPQGANCPYIDEYQHSLEFSHDHNPRNAPTNRNDSYVPHSPPSDRFTPFAGSGLRLGTGGGGGNRLLQEFEEGLRRAEQLHQSNQNVSNRPKAATKSSSSNGFGAKAANTICCSLCGLNLPKDEAKDHYLLHQLESGINKPSSSSTQSSSNKYDLTRQSNAKPNPVVLVDTPDHTRKLRDDRRNQDVEYDQSVLEEIRQKSEADELEKQKKLKEQQEKEKEAYIQAMKESKRLLEIEEQRKAIIKLLPEPTPETYSSPIVAIRFRLPSGAKLIRKFRINNSMQDAFDYLKTLPELVHSKYMLQSVVGAITYKAPIHQTFKEAAITSNTTLIVVVLDDEDEAGDLSPLSEELSQVEIAPTSRNESKNKNKRERVEDSDEVIVIDSKKMKPTTSVTFQQRKEPTDCIDLT